MWEEKRTDHNEGQKKNKQDDQALLTCEMKELWLQMSVNILALVLLKECSHSLIADCACA